MVGGNDGDGWGGLLDKGEEKGRGGMEEEEEGEDEEQNAAKMYEFLSLQGGFVLGVLKDLYEEEKGEEWKGEQGEEKESGGQVDKKQQLKSLSGPLDVRMSGRATRGLKIQKGGEIQKIEQTDPLRSSSGVSFTTKRTDPSPRVLRAQTPTYGTPSPYPPSLIQMTTVLRELLSPPAVSYLSSPSPCVGGVNPLSLSFPTIIPLSPPTKEN